MLGLSEDDDDDDDGDDDGGGDDGVGHRVSCLELRMSHGDEKRSHGSCGRRGGGGMALGAFGRHSRVARFQGTSRLQQRKAEKRLP